MITLQLLDTDSFGVLPRDLLRQLEPGEEERAERLRPSERRRFLIGRIALRKSLSETLGGDPSSWRLIVGKTGKVSLAHAHGKPFTEFSLSYAGNAIAIAISTSGPIGVDLEEAVPIQETAIPAEQFSDCEKEHLALLPESERRIEALRLWTRKEACSKFLGEGLNLDFSDLDVLHGDRPGLSVETCEVSIAGKPYFLSLARNPRPRSAAS